MKRTEIKKMSKDEIVKNIDKFKKDLFNFRFQKMNSQVTNPAKIGETKKTKEFSNSENFFNSLVNCCFLSGKKPQNKNLSEKPLIETAAATAEGPGM